VSAGARAIRAVTARLLKVSARSYWILVEVGCADGATGVGEASLHVSQRQVKAAAELLGGRLLGLEPPAALAALDPWREDDLVRASAICALDQALNDLEAQAAGIPLCRRFSDRPAPQLEVYANINRRTHDRSPEGFAASARDAVAAGFGALKIAPFDDVAPSLGVGDAAPLLDAGFARIEAVRAVLGHRRLLVDCHWRLSPEMLGPVLDVCVANHVFWLETPFPEELDRIQEIRAVRARANARGVRTAGCELKIGRAGFAPYIAAGAYDVVMPDMKYVGGYQAFLSVSADAAAAGLAVSPHNPTGPVCHAHTVQASAAIAPFLILEMQFDETPAFEAIVEGALPMPTDGHLQVPHTPGLGIRLRHEALSALEVA